MKELREVWKGKVMNRLESEKKDLMFNSVFNKESQWSCWKTGGDGVNGDGSGLLSFGPGGVYEGFSVGNQ